MTPLTQPDLEYAVIQRRLPPADPSSGGTITNLGLPTPDTSPEMQGGLSLWYTDPYDEYHASLPADFYDIGSSSRNANALQTLSSSVETWTEREAMATWTIPDHGFPHLRRESQRARTDSATSLLSDTSLDSGYCSAPPKSLNPTSNPVSNADRDHALDLADSQHSASDSVRAQKHPATFQCTLCPKRFSRAYNLRSHLRTRHENMHSGEKRFVCRGDLQDETWGCGRRFTRADALGRHIVSEAGRACIRPLLDEDEDRRSTAAAFFELPSLIKQQYPALTSLWETLFVKEQTMAAERIDDDVETRVEECKMAAGIQWQSEAKAHLSPVDNNTTIELGRPCPDGKTKDLFDFRYPAAFHPTITLNDHAKGTTGHTLDQMTDERDETDPTSEAIMEQPVTKIDNDFMSSAGRAQDVTAEEKLRRSLQLREDSGKHGLDSKLPFERCSTPSTIRDEDMPSDTEDDTSEPETLLSPTASSVSMWPGSPRPIERDALAGPILDEARRQLVEKLMVEVRLLLNGLNGIRSRANSTESTNSGTSQENAGGTSAGTANNNRKRSRNEGGGSGSPGDEPNEDIPEKRPKPENPSIEEKQRKFACPYYKRNSRLHEQYRSCAGPGWTTCHRVKEHIYRRHKLPIRCPRCCTRFSNERELQTHLRLPEGCQIRQEETLEGIDKAQEAQLKSRKKLPGLEEQRWREMYMILFPDDCEDSIPSPYYENEAEQSDNLAEYDRFLARELPRLVRGQLEATIFGASLPLESQIQAQLVDMIQDCRRQLFRTYTATVGPQMPASAGIPSQTSDEAAPSDTRSTNIWYDMSAVFPPPPLPDTTASFSYDNSMQYGGGWCPPAAPTTYTDFDFDSAYGSGIAASADSFAMPEQSNANAPSQGGDGFTHLATHLPTSQPLRNDEQQQTVSSRTTSADPWSSLTHPGQFPRHWSQW